MYRQLRKGRSLRQICQPFAFLEKFRIRNESSRNVRIEKKHDQKSL